MGAIAASAPISREARPSSLARFLVPVGRRPVGDVAEIPGGPRGVSMPLAAADAESSS